MLIDLDRLKSDYARLQNAVTHGQRRDFSGPPHLWSYDFLVRDRLFRDVSSLLGALADRTSALRILDLGAGQSPFRDIAQARGATLETLDSDPALKPDHVGEAARANLPDASFDIILCTSVIEHCPDPQAVVKEIHRLLKGGGHAILSAPHMWFYHPHPGDFWRFTPEGLAHLCREGGLRVREIRSQGGSALAVFQVINFSAYGLLGRWGTPLYILLNLLGGVVDRLFPNPYFAVSFACLASKTL